MWRGAWMVGEERAVEIRVLAKHGMGVREIAREVGVSRNTVRRYLREGGWTGYGRVRRTPALAGLGAWLSERLARHGGNADVVRQELASERGVAVSLRTVERACAPHRQRLLASALATVRCERRPGERMQIDPRIESEGRPRRAPGVDRG